jgi:hypothetical protein
VVKDDGTADCAIPAVSGVSRGAKVAGDGIFSCSCALGGPRSAARGGWFAMALSLTLGILFGARRRRWR